MRWSWPASASSNCTRIGGSPKKQSSGGSGSRLRASRHPLPPTRNLELEHQLECQLNEPRTSIAQGIYVGHIRGAGNCAESRAIQRHIRQCEVRVVEDIEELRAELQVDSLAKHR